MPHLPLPSSSPSLCPRPKNTDALYRYGSGDEGAEYGRVTGPRLIQLLQKHRDSALGHWDSVEQASYYTYDDPEGEGEPVIVYYPSKSSLSARTALSAELGIGIAVGPIGSGLDSFFDTI